MENGYSAEQGLGGPVEHEVDAGESPALHEEIMGKMPALPG